MRNLGLGLMLLMSAGCIRGAGSWEGIWMVQVPLYESSDCDPDIDENFKDASVPEDIAVEDGEWSFEEDYKVSDAVYFVQVLEDGGEVFVIVDDTPYYGTADGKTLTATWTDFTDSESVMEHDQGYTFEQTNNSEATTTFTFTRGSKGVYTGTVDVQVKSEISYAETDEWEPADVLFNQGEINGPADSWLDEDSPGGTQNAANDDDCDGGDCELTIKTNCKDTIDVQVFYAGDHDEGMYNSLEDATRDFGGGGGGYY